MTKKTKDTNGGAEETESQHLKKKIVFMNNNNI